MVIELHHPTDPRYLLVDELPEDITMDDLSTQKYGKLMLMQFADVDCVYHRPDPEGPWIPKR